MLKQVQFFGKTESGIFCQSLFGSSGAFEKTAGAPPFSDWETGDELRKFLRTLTAEKRKQNAYVLVNALGGSEYFGSNINADWFPWNALAHEGDDYGYKTFLNAHAFQHHKNKDPARAFGKPVLSVLNPRMKRVELIIELNRERAIAEGADGIIQRIDAGEFPDVSMGCKVPYDVCSICGHQSKTRADYCFPPGTPILVEGNQYVPIERVQAGDLVVTHTGKLRRVTHLLPGVTKDGLVVVEAFGFGTIRATPNHPFLVARTKTGVQGGRKAQLDAQPPDFVHAVDVQLKDTVFLPIQEVVESDMQHPSLGRLLGLYLAEGHLGFSEGVSHPKSATFSYHLKEDFRELIEKASLLLDPEATFSTFTYEGRNGQATRVNSRKVAEWLWSHGGRGSKHKLLSPAVWAYGRIFARCVLEGWSLGDGSYDEGNNILRVATSSEDLARQMQMLAAGVGVLAGLKLHSRDTNFGYQDIWYVSFCGDAAKAVFERRPQVDFSKQSKLFFWKNYLCSTVKSVSHEEYSGPTFNFEVEGDNSYVAGSYAVHNCQHMMPPPELRGVYGPNKLMPDGRRICVYNLTPRFFDISFVFIGADKTAKVMAKIASKGAQVCLGDVCEIPRPSAEVYELVDAVEDSGLQKVASEVSSKELALGEAIEKKEHQKSVEKIYKGIAKDHLKEHPHFYTDELKREQKEKSAAESCDMCKTAEALHKKSAAHKLATIVKDVPSGAFAMKRLPKIERLEPDLPKDLLDGLSEVPLTDLLSGTAGMGVILKPREFQRSVLNRMGEGSLADELDQKNKVFRQVNDSTNMSMPNDMLGRVRELLPLLAPHIHSRTAFGEPFRIRIMVISGGGKPLATPEPIKHPLLDKISAAYNGYRREVMMKLSQAVNAVQSDPKLRELVLGENLVNSFTKSASPSRVLSFDSVVYLSGAHLENRGLLSDAATADAIAASNQNLLDEEISAQGF